MKTYIGTKLISARPMTRREYNEYRNWVLPDNEDGSDEGYLVEYLDGGKPNDSRHAGYISWSPKVQFEQAYKESTGLTFGLALEALKKGYRVTRAGWNGRGMWLALSSTEDRIVEASQFWSPHNEQFAVMNGGSATVLPCITMKTVNASGREAILMGWLASQTDMLSDDWQIV